MAVRLMRLFWPKRHSICRPKYCLYVRRLLVLVIACFLLYCAIVYSPTMPVTSFNAIGEMPLSLKQMKAKMREHSVALVKPRTIRRIRGGQLRSPKVKLSGSTMRLDAYLVLRAIWAAWKRDSVVMGDGECFLAVFDRLVDTGRIDIKSLSRVLDALKLTTDLVPGSAKYFSKPQERSLPAGMEFCTPLPQQVPRTRSIPTLPPVIRPPRHNSYALRSALKESVKAISWSTTSDRRLETDGNRLSAYLTAFQTFLAMVGDFRGPVSQPREESSNIQDTLKDDADIKHILANNFRAFDLEDSPTNNIRRNQRQDHSTMPPSTPPPVEDHSLRVKDDLRPQTDETSTTVFIVSYFTALSHTIHRSFSKTHSMEPKRNQYSCRPRGASEPYFRTAIDTHVPSEVSSTT
jgi:hypothetical protein